MCKKEIDIYFITGQSNASGSTKVMDEAALIADHPQFESGTAPYIIYSGNAAANDPDNSVTYGWGSVKVGFGAGVGRMGPELGITKSLSDLYNEQTGRVAGIIKYAHGGTGFCHTEANTKANEKTGRYSGNWSPASYSKHYPDDPALSYIGFLYRGFLDEVRKRIKELLDMGYAKINLKGLYWMQGCNDTWRYTEGEETEKKSPRWYPEAFACLVKDWRRELSAIMTELLGSDCGACTLPFFIGTISPTYRMGDAAASFGMRYTDNGEFLEATKKRNDPFISMQKRLAEDNPYCYIVDNGEYVTVRHTVNPDGTVSYHVIGTDVSHWGQAECYEVGKGVGKMFLKICT